MKQKNLRRPKIITFRLSVEEADSLRQQATNAGYNLQKFIFDSIKNRPLIDKNQLEKVFVELRRSGVNLNQIAHNLNANRHVAVERITEAVEQHKKLEEEVWRFLRR